MRTRGREEKKRRSEDTKKTKEECKTSECLTKEKDHKQKEDAAFEAIKQAGQKKANLKGSDAGKDKEAIYRQETRNSAKKEGGQARSIRRGR